VASALDPLRSVMPAARKLHADLARRKAERLPRSRASAKGWETKRMTARADRQEAGRP
jgi:hypothetical protein